MFISLDIVVSNHCMLSRPDCKHLPTQTVRLQFKLFIKNGVISWFNIEDTNYINIKDVVSWHVKAVLREFTYSRFPRVKQYGEQSVCHKTALWQNSRRNYPAARILHTKFDLACDIMFVASK